MLKSRLLHYQRQCGTTLLEVLVTIIILAFGLLGLAGLQSRIQLAELESYQRAQAILVLADMTERIRLNNSQAASYVSAGTIGTGDSQPSSCAGIAVGPNRDTCGWSNSLKGARETQSAANVGAMVGALGCITQLQAPDATAGVCTPGIYLVSVAWQGMSPTVTPSITCGTGSYGTNDSYRRVISSQITVGLTSC